MIHSAAAGDALGEQGSFVNSLQENIPGSKKHRTLERLKGAASENSGLFRNYESARC
jgi:hypothetical protein